MSRAPSLLDSVPPDSSPTKPTFSFFCSACAPGNTPPLRDFCTMAGPRTELRSYSLAAGGAARRGAGCGSIAAGRWRRKTRREGEKRSGLADQQIFILCVVKRRDDVTDPKRFRGTVIDYRCLIVSLSRTEPSEGGYHGNRSGGGWAAF